MTTPRSPSRETIAVGMSGGIDSTITAWLLREQGYEVIGLTMSIWRPGAIALDAPPRSACYGPGEADDLAAARDAAAALGIPHHTIELADEWEAQVLDEFRRQHLAGRTPNPCAICNPIMKFGLLPEQARARGIQFDRFATGHYAQILPPADAAGYRLLRGRDAAKDQSYFLARLTQRQLAMTLFPLGHLTKRDVRDLARQAGMATLADKRESQDFFEGEDIGLLFGEAADRPGPIVDETGRELGQHRGIVRYTIGQRDGLGIAAGRRLYVKSICAQTNTLVVSDRDRVCAMGCRLRDMHWIAGAPPPADTARVLLRYRHAGAEAQWSLEADATLLLRFREPQFAVTPGQLAALYDGDDVLGSGWIEPSITTIYCSGKYHL